MLIFDALLIRKASYLAWYLSNIIEVRSLFKYSIFKCSDYIYNYSKENEAILEKEFFNVKSRGVFGVTKEEGMEGGSFILFYVLRAKYL
jgi:hypothetical protein